jgi:hypothetical protein
MKDSNTIFATLIDGSSIAGLSTFYDKTKSLDFYIDYFVAKAKKENRLINPFVNRMFFEQFDDFGNKIRDEKGYAVERTIFHKMEGIYANPVLTK